METEPATGGEADDRRPRRLGQYEVIRPLGRGGMGEVYLARDLRLGRLVAVKLLTSLSPDLDERLLAEARATARCRHDNIVVIYEVAAQRGQPYLVLEYLEGQTLREWMVEHAARVSPARAIDLMLPVVRALAYAHDQDIVHRDLKPENVMLTRTGAIKVLDFGVAAEIGATAGSIAGTRGYMAPEQLAAAAIDHRVDLWAVGVMLFELVAGGRPDSPNAVRELGPLTAVIDRCLIEDPARRTSSALALLAELEALASVRRPVSGESPFAGLAAFQEADAARFYGRDRDIAQVTAELRSRPLVAIVGPSGAGKSSLIRAGIIPALKRVDDGYDAHIVRPGREPLAALAGIVDDVAIDQLRTEPGTLGARLRAKQRRTVVFVDQLEELYTQGSSPADAAAFLACLNAIADDASSPLRVLVSMRSDFLERLAENRQLGAEVARSLVLLSPMDRDGMREALVRPVEAFGHRFETPALVDRMVAAVATTRGALPLLQFTAARLWDRRDHDHHVLTEASYDELGGVEGALASHADAVLAAMSADQQTLTRAVMMRLVTPDRTRALVSLAELHALRGDPALVDDVVQHLVAMRLVIAESGGEDASAIVELVHESLIDRWPTLVRWLAEDQDDAAMHARVRVAARDWERDDHATSLLWSGEAAAQVRVWQARFRGELTSLEQRYLAAVIAAADRARRIRRRIVGAIVAASVLAALVMGWLTWRQTEARHAADAEAMRARDAVRLAAVRAVRDDPTTQLVILRELEDPASATPAILAELRRLIHARVPRRVRVSPAGGHSLDFSPDGKHLVMAGTAVVSVWNADGTGDPVVLRGHQGTVDFAAYGPDNRRVASAGDDHTARVWNADGSGTPTILPHGDRVTSVRFSRDGKRLLTAAQDGTVHVWDIANGRPLLVLHQDTAANRAVWSPDERHIAVAGDDRALRIYPADGTGEPLILRGHDGVLTSVAYSPDGARIVTTSDDRTIRIWNADGRGEPVSLRGHTDEIHDAVFTPDGTQVVSVSTDRTARIWNADGSDQPVVLTGHSEAIYGVAVSPDGRHIVTTAIDRTVRWWDADDAPDPVVLRGHDGGIDAVAVSPDGVHVASGGRDRTIRVWRTDGVGEPIVLRGHEAPVSSIAFSPDAKHIVSGGDSTIRIWNADGSGTPRVLRGHTAPINAVAYSRDGRSIASGSEDQTVRVWNADGTGEPVVLPGQLERIRVVVFSADGRYVFAASSENVVRRFSVDGKHHVDVVSNLPTLRELAVSRDGDQLAIVSRDGHVRITTQDGAHTIHEPTVPCTAEKVAFNPDATLVAIGCHDSTVFVVRSDGTGDPVELVGHQAIVNGVQFTADGKQLVSASQDGTVRVWRDFAPITLADPRIWKATSYCSTIGNRTTLWVATEERAKDEQERCEARVAAAGLVP